MDAGVAAHYGAPTREARSLFDGTAVADLSHLDILQLRGEDRLTWLDTISSQRLSDVKPGQSTQSLLLSVQGRVEHELKILAADDLLWIIAEPGRGEPLAEYLNSMRFMSRVEVVDCSNTHGVIASTRPRPELGDVVWENPWPNVIGGGHAYSTGEHPGLERPWLEYIVPLEQLASLVGDLPLAGTMAVEALRIAAWEPRFIVDTDDKSIPHELDWLRTAVHLNKAATRARKPLPGFTTWVIRRVAWRCCTWTVHAYPACARFTGQGRGTGCRPGHLGGIALRGWADCPGHAAPQCAAGCRTGGPGR